jgi:DNA polymerase-3 subunit beta
VAFLEKGIIVPRKGVGEIRKLCEETEDTVEIGLGEGFLLVRCPGQLLSCRLIDGEFPDYKQILPDGHLIRVLIEREVLLHAVRRIALVAHERAGGFRLALEDGQMELHAQNPDLGEARELIPVEYQSDRFETGFNARYLQDAIASIASKEVVLELRDELTPAQIRPADDPDQIAIVMPMRL